jgi:uncharacterized protein YkwD
MHRVLALVAVAALVWGCKPESPERRATPTVAGGAQGPLAGIVESHNAVRREARPKPSPPLPPLELSPGLVDDAQAWAERCSFRHSETAGGENLYAGTSEPSAREVVGAWATEAAAYDYASNGCSGLCGHYTQMVWRDTTRVGCAAHRCTTGSPFDARTWWLVVCRYEPAGNIVGERPY